MSKINHAVLIKVFFKFIFTIITSHEGKLKSYVADKLNTTAYAHVTANDL